MVFTPNPILILGLILGEAKDSKADADHAPNMSLTLTLALTLGEAKDSKADADHVQARVQRME